MYIYLKKIGYKQGRSGQLAVNSLRVSNMFWLGQLTKFKVLLYC